MIKSILIGIFAALASVGYVVFWMWAIDLKLDKYLFSLTLSGALVFLLVLVGSQMIKKRLDKQGR